MKNLSEEEISLYIDCLMEATEEDNIEWNFTAIFASYGAHIFDTRHMGYNLRLIHQQDSKYLWIGKEPISRPKDWRCYQHKVRLEQLVKIIRRKIGLDEVDSGINGFDIDEFRKVMQLSGELK